MKHQKSAKDIAFEKERVKFRQEIKNLKYQIEYRDKQIAELTATIQQREEELFKQEDWIRRLLEYTEISKEDLQSLIESEKDKAEIRERVLTTLGIIGMIGGRTFL